MKQKIVILKDSMCSKRGAIMEGELVNYYLSLPEEYDVNVIEINIEDNLSSDIYSKKISECKPERIITIDMAGFYLLNYVETPIIEDFSCPKYHVLCARPWNYAYLCNWHMSVNSYYFTIFDEDTATFKTYYGIQNIESMHRFMSVDSEGMEAKLSIENALCYENVKEYGEQVNIEDLPDYMKQIAEIIDTQMKKYSYVEAMEHTFEEIGFVVDHEEFLLLMKDFSFVSNRFCRHLQQVKLMGNMRENTRGDETKDVSEEGAAEENMEVLESVIKMDMERLNTYLQTLV